jgi:Flp pilus assembly protein CpaB
MWSQESLHIACRPVRPKIAQLFDNKALLAARPLASGQRWNTDPLDWKPWHAESAESVRIFYKLKYGLRLGPLSL